MTVIVIGSLTAALGTTLNYGAIAIAIVWIAAYYGVEPAQQARGEVRRGWADLTAPLREKGPSYPPAAGFALAVVAFALAVYTSASALILLVVLGVPLWIVITVSRHGIGALLVAIGEARAPPDATPDTERFALPMDVYDSEADDVTPANNAVAIPRRSLLTLGASGSGKSTTLKHFVAQIDVHETPTIVFDMKTDYQDTLRQWGVPMTRLSASSSDVRWNIFEEVDRESDIDEFARALFAGDEANDAFFGTAGRQLFAATIKVLYREFDDPTNADLRDYWLSSTPEQMHDDLTADGHEDLISAAAAIDPDAGRQASGVYATAQQQVADLFVDDFGDVGDFSLRAYFEDPSDYGVLVLDYPSRQAETVGPLFKLLIDSAIAHGMDAPNRQAYFLLDEIEHMSVPLSRIGELINVGRGANCQAILSLQSVAQLYDTYGKHRGKALLSGMTTSVILRLGDDESINFARSAIGTHFEEYTGHTEQRPNPFGNGMVTTKRETRTSEEHDFAKGDFAGFDPGECVVCRAGSGYVHGRVRMLE